MKTATQTIRFGHSPDPDDAFMFYAIAKNKISTDGFQIEHVVEDIESLNQRALKNAELEATAVSVHAFAYLADKYAIMRAGASIGEKYGPIVVARKHLGQKQGQSLPGRQAGQKAGTVPKQKRRQSPNVRDRSLRAKSSGTGPKNKRTDLSLTGKTIAIPGKLTTANLILQLFEPNFIPEIVPFDQILDHVAEGKSDAGLIIHEGQITYQEKNLHKVMDLGEWWWEKTKLPLPLGIDVIRKDLGEETMQRLSKVFKESILYALENRKPALDYAIQFGRGLRADLNDRFVGMYVNDYTIDLGEAGERGIRKIFELGGKSGILPSSISAQVQFV